LAGNLIADYANKGSQDWRGDSLVEFIRETIAGFWDQR
jgi:hypothetical protein